MNPNDCPWLSRSTSTIGGGTSQPRWAGVGKGVAVDCTGSLTAGSVARELGSRGRMSRNGTAFVASLTGSWTTRFNPVQDGPVVDGKGTCDLSVLSAALGGTGDDDLESGPV